MDKRTATLLKEVRQKHLQLTYVDTYDTTDSFCVRFEHYKKREVEYSVVVSFDKENEEEIDIYILTDYFSLNFGLVTLLLNQYNFNFRYFSLLYDTNDNQLVLRACVDCDDIHSLVSIISTYIEASKELFPIIIDELENFDREADLIDFLEDVDLGYYDNEEVKPLKKENNNNDCKIIEFDTNRTKKGK